MKSQSKLQSIFNWMWKQTLLDVTEAVVNRKVKALNAYIRKEERFQINDLSFHLKLPEKEQIRPRMSRRKE